MRFKISKDFFKEKISQPEQGNVFFLILAAIALLAGLNFTMARTGQSPSSLSTEESSLAAERILQYASEVENGIHLMANTGIADTDYCFFTPRWQDATLQAHYNDSPSCASPGNNSRVFYPEGGGVTWQQADPTWFDDRLDSGSSSYGHWHFSGIYDVIGVGTPGAGDLVAVLMPLKQEICWMINHELGWSNPAPPSDSIYVTMSAGAVKFGYNGVYYTAAHGIGNTAALMGKTAGCGAHTATDPDTYYFFKVLHAR